VRASTAISDEDRERLLKIKDRRLSKDGVIVIKSQRYRSQDKNRSDALERLAETIRTALVVEKPRKATKPSKKSRRKRLDEKTRRGRLKESRGKVSE
jgi:ribosome-associated protein